MERHTHTHTHEGNTMDNETTLEEGTINHGEWEEPTLDYTQHWLNWIELRDPRQLEWIIDENGEEQ